MDSSAISVIVQGPVVPEGRGPISTLGCLQSIRQSLPRAEVLLSTWENQPSQGLDFDVLVQSVDPGGQQRPDGLWHNVNRQIVSTLAGLRRATRLHAVKMRTDCRLESARFLETYERRPIDPRFPTLFRDWVLSPELYSRNPEHLACVRLFLPSDIFFFGLRSDLLDLWDCPLHPDGFVTREWHEWRYCAEQWLWLNFLWKRGWKIDLKRHDEFSLLKAWKSERSLMHNFIISSSEQIGLRLSPPNTGEWFSETAYTHAEWRRLHRDYQTACGTFRRLAKLARIHAPGLWADLSLKLKHSWIRLKTKLAP